LRIAVSFPGCHRRGGIERVVLESVNFLASRGHDVHLYVSDWDKDALSREVTVHPIALPVPGALPRLLTFARRSRAALAASRPAADVHAAFGVQSPPGGVMWVPSVHRAWLEASRTQRNWKGRLKQKANPIHPALLRLERAYFTGRRRPRRLIALTDQVKADLVRFYGLPPEEIAVLPNGYSPTEFSTARAGELREPMRQKLGYAADDKVVVFVANELERKGFGPLLRAIAGLNNDRLHLLAVGRLDRGAYAAEIARLGMTERVQFTGPSGDVATYYAAADVFALPTQYEAWGLVIVEAMACGLPVVTSRLAGAAIAVREGETGLLLDDPNDPQEIASKIQALLTGPKRSGKAIEASIMHYSWPDILGRFEQHLRECAAPTEMRP